MGHAHSHTPATAGAAHRRRLGVVLGLTLAVLAAEVVGAVLSGSLALLADAGHMATDAAGLALALAAVSLAQRPARGRRTFGWQRIEILAAVANGLLLVAVAVYVLVEAIQRIGRPPEIGAGLMLVVAAVGLVVNLGSIVLLHRGREDVPNVRAPTCRWWPTRWLGRRHRRRRRHRDHRLDIGGHRASAVIVCPVLPRAWHLLREAFDVLLEPRRAADLQDVRAHILGVDGVPRRPRPARLDDHVRAAGALGARRRQRRRAGRRALRPRARRALLLPRRALRPRALHLPARGRRARGPRVPGPRRATAATAGSVVGQWSGGTG